MRCGFVHWLCSLGTVTALKPVPMLQVRLWQNQQQTQAKQQGYVCTLLGRQRQLPDAGKKGPGTGGVAGHALRAAINTPVQGSAADVATAAMISINNCQRLKELGWKLLLQVRGHLVALPFA